MSEQADSQQQVTIDASQNTAAPNNVPDDLTKQDLDQVAGGLSFSFGASMAHVIGVGSSGN